MPTKDLGYFLARAAGKLQDNCGILGEHFTKYLTQVAARPSTC